MLGSQLNPIASPVDYGAIKKMYARLKFLPALAFVSPQTIMFPLQSNVAQNYRMHFKCIRVSRGNRINLRAGEFARQVGLAIDFRDFFHADAEQFVHACVRACVSA